VLLAVTMVVVCACHHLAAIQMSTCRATESRAAAICSRHVTAVVTVTLTIIIIIIIHRHHLVPGLSHISSVSSRFAAVVDVIMRNLKLHILPVLYWRQGDAFSF